MLPLTPKLAAVVRLTQTKLGGGLVIRLGLAMVGAFAIGIAIDLALAALDIPFIAAPRHFSQWGILNTLLVMAAALIAAWPVAAALRQMEAALRRLAQNGGETSGSLPLPTGPDEIGAISRAVRDLADSIGKRHAAEHREWAEQMRDAAALRRLPVAALAESDGTVISGNPALAALFGYQPDELKGLPWRRLYAGDADLARIAHDFARCSDSEELFIGEAEMRRKDGSVFWCRLQAYGGKEAFTTWLCTDIGRARRAEAEALERRTRLEKLVAERTRQLEAARQEAPPPAASPRSGTHAAPGPQGMAQALVAFDLAAVVDGVAATLMPLAEAKAQELLVDIDGQVPAPLLGAPDTLAQVLTELLCNAIHHTRRGEVALVVRQVGGADGRVRLLFSIRDQGAATVRERQEESAAAGMAIAHRLVERLGGTLGVGSAYGQGCLHYFTADFGMATGGGGKADPYADALRPFAGGRIMLVDDNRSARQVSAARLAELGFVPDPFESPWAALAALDKSDSPAYTAICIDRHMPDMDGLELARRLQKKLGSACPPLLLTTVFSTVAEAKAAVYGFSAVVSKPVSLDRLYTQIAAVLGVAESRPSSLPAAIMGKRLLLLGEGDFLLPLADVLAAAGLVPRLAGDLTEALQSLREDRPDGLLLDCRHGLEQARQACATLRASAPAGLPIIGLVSRIDDADRAPALVAGMSDLAACQADSAGLLARLAKWLSREGKELPPLPPELDVESGLRHLRGKTDLFLKALRMFRDNCGLRFQQDFRAAIAAGDWPTSARLAHNLRGTAATIGAKQVASAAGRLETAIRAACYAEIDPLLDDVTQKLQVLVEGLARIG